MFHVKHSGAGEIHPHEEEAEAGQSEDPLLPVGFIEEMGSRTGRTARRTQTDRQG